MTRATIDNGRRRFAYALGAAFFTVPGAFAEALTATPRQTEGPFYPDKLPLDTDNDLIIVNDTTTPAVGTISHVGGRILDEKGDPIRNAVVEIWQADNNGAYLHSGTANADKRDSHFQGFGRFLTGSTGEYYFRTIRPVPYPGRTPHIHFIVNVHGKRMLTTQLYVAEEKERNERDGLYQRIRDPKARRSVTVPFSPLKESRIGELAANFDIVIGSTPEDPEEDRFRRPGLPPGRRTGRPPRRQR